MVCCNQFVGCCGFYNDGENNMTKRKRDYVHENIWKGTREQKRLRAMRNRNRRIALQKGIAEKGDGTSIHHIDGNPANNDPDNLIILDHCTHTELHGGENECDDAKRIIRQFKEEES